VVFGIQASTLLAEGFSQLLLRGNGPVTGLRCAIPFPTPPAPNPTGAYLE
jgi:hypothetical protein